MNRIRRGASRLSALGERQSEADQIGRREGCDE
ncbi:hypothetical protein TPMD04_22 [Thiohalocapsa phage LS06-2018-MD04]|nr:hypothetical protein TPMD04_22 [Thiohalocapsa phage LS06-2018-MD04]